MLSGYFVKIAQAQQSTEEFGQANNLLRSIMENVVNPVVYLLMALAVVYFLYGMVEFLRNADNPDERQTGYNHMLWGIIGLFIMIAAKGVVNVIANTLGVPTVH